jgi:glycosyltransferase involved in cell wall biosynthesis
MRILTFLHSFEPGGVERIALRLIQRWRELGVDAPLFLGRTDGKMREDVGSAIDWIAPKPPRIPTAGWETLWMICTLPRAIRRLRPDILFCAGNTYTIVAIALKLLLGRDCPPILAKISNNLDRYDLPWWRRWPYRLWLRVQGRFLDHLIGMEHPMAGEIRDAMRISEDRITIIPDPALSQQLIDRLRAAPEIPVGQRTGRRFVAIGRLTSQKNVALMLRAFRRGAATGDVLTIIGDGPDRQKLTKLAAELDLGDRVEFRGYVSEPSVLLPQFDIFLLSSNYEGVPAVILEALAARLTIIATDCSRSMASLLQFGELGKLVAVRDELELAAAIADALPGSSNDALSLAQVQRFTLERSAEAYLRAMNRLAQNGTGEFPFGSRPC